MHRLKIVFLLLTMISAAAMGQDKVQEGISLAFKAGNATELSKYFNSEIELVILDKEDLYSKKQAEQILKKFFTDHSPTSFRIIFEGGKETSRYAIGNLSTENQVYRTYLLIKKENGNSLIHQLRIEVEDEQTL